jgi:hypothetical protein
MTDHGDPTRHRDERDLPEVWRRSLEAARKEKPERGRLAHLRGAVLTAAASLGAAGTAAASATATATVLGVKAKVVVGALVVGGAVAGLHAVVPERATPSTQERPAGAAAPKDPPTSAPAPVLPPSVPAVMEEDEPHEAMEDDVAAPEVGQAEPAPPPSPSPGTPRSPALPRSEPEAKGATREEPEATKSPNEMQLIRRAHLLVKSDPDAALRLVAEHAARFPNGVFAQEREVLAIDALLHAGRRAEAKARGRRFIQAHPDSPHIPRLRALLARGDGSP